MVLAGGNSEPGTNAGPGKVRGHGVDHVAAVGDDRGAAWREGLGRCVPAHGPDAHMVRDIDEAERVAADHVDVLGFAEFVDLGGNLDRDVFGDNEDRLYATRGLDHVLDLTVDRFRRRVDDDLVGMPLGREMFQEVGIIGKHRKRGLLFDRDLGAPLPSAQPPTILPA